MPAPAPPSASTPSAIHIGMRFLAPAGAGGLYWTCNGGGVTATAGGATPGVNAGPGGGTFGVNAGPVGGVPGGGNGTFGGGNVGGANAAPCWTDNPALRFGSAGSVACSACSSSAS